MERPGDPLPKVDEVVDWEGSRSRLERIRDKHHISRDRAQKLIRRWKAAAAQIHDGQVFGGLLGRSDLQYRDDEPGLQHPAHRLAGELSLNRSAREKMATRVGRRLSD